MAVLIQIMASFRLGETHMRKSTILIFFLGLIIMISGCSRYWLHPPSPLVYIIGSLACILAIILTTYSWKRNCVNKNSAAKGNSLIEKVVTHNNNVESVKNNQNYKIDSAKDNKIKHQESLVEAVVQRQLRMMEPHDEKYIERDPNCKIRRCQFRPTELIKIQVSQSQDQKPETQFVESEEVTQQKEQTTEITFKTLQELDYFLPSIEGTLNDFMQAVKKFTETLSPFLKEADEKTIAHCSEDRHYSKLTEFLVGKALENRHYPFVQELLKSVEFKRLQYGQCFSFERANIKPDRYNLKLYKDIVYLLQEIFLRNVNEVHKSSYHSLEELLEIAPWEMVENFHLEKSVEEMGKTISDILVENFLNSLKPLKKTTPSEYRFLRLTLRYLNVKEPLEMARVILRILEEIQQTYDKIQHEIAVKSRQEIAKLLETTKVVPKFKAIPKEKIDISAEEAEEKQIHETILAVVKFLGWLPQEMDLITEEEKNLIAYFNKLMYSRRTRLAIAKDTEKKAEAETFEKKLKRVADKIKEAEEKLDIIGRHYRGNLINAEVDIAIPRQSEDYFPVHGVIEKIIRDPFQNTNIIKMEIRESNHLLSVVVFTGINVTFCSATN